MILKRFQRNPFSGFGAYSVQTLRQTSGNLKNENAYRPRYRCRLHIPMLQEARKSGQVYHAAMFLGFSTEILLKSMICL